MPRCGHCPNRGNKSGSTNFVTWRQGTIFVPSLESCVHRAKEIRNPARECTERKRAFHERRTFPNAIRRNCVSSPSSSGAGCEGPYPGGGETRVRRWSYERLNRDPPLHIRSSRSQTSGALCAQMSPPNSYRKVHTKINVSCTAGPIACSSNDSARDPAGTTFLLTEGSKSSAQLPTRLPPTWKPETATISDCA
jgi:hypothetical protein